MLNKSMIIQVSFKKDESKLYTEVMMRCKLSGKSGWIKEAIVEKMAREENGQTGLLPEQNVSYQQNNNDNMIDGIIDALM